MTLTVTDNGGQTGSQTQAVTVNAQAPAPGPGPRGRVASRGRLALALLDAALFDAVDQFSPSSRSLR
jgi:hypothetical protein